MRTRHTAPEIYRVTRRAPSAPAPEPAVTPPHRRDLALELGPGWTRSIVLRAQAAVLELGTAHHGVSALGCIVLRAEHVTAVLDILGRARRGETFRARLWADGRRYVRVISAADGLRLRQHTPQKLGLGPRPIPLDARELDALERGLVALASTARAA